jgi:hypothetical protein
MSADAGRVSFAVPSPRLMADALAAIHLKRGQVRSAQQARRTGCLPALTS